MAIPKIIGTLSPFGAKLMLIPHRTFGTPRLSTGSIVELQSDPRRPTVYISPVVVINRQCCAPQTTVSTWANKHGFYAMHDSGHTKAVDHVHCCPCLTQIPLTTWDSIPRNQDSASQLFLNSCSIDSNSAPTVHPTPHLEWHVPTTSLIIDPKFLISIATTPNDDTVMVRNDTLMCGFNVFCLKIS